MRSFKKVLSRTAGAILAVALYTSTPIPAVHAEEVVAPPASTTPPASRFYTVAEVLTGDTFRLTTGTQVAYASIQAPPLVHQDPKVREYGRQSAAFNKALIEGKQIRVEFGARIKNDDGVYQGFVFLEDGTFANLKMIEAGYAKLNIVPPDLRYADELRRASGQSRRAGTGLWEHENKLERRFVFIGDQMTHKFHFKGCDALDGVSKAHLRRFDSSVDAKAAGYAFCSVCRHTYAQETDLF